jgi:hypothetical protein
MNSSSAMLYADFLIGEEALSSTSNFNFCHCAIFSTQSNRSFVVLLLVNNGDTRRSLPATVTRPSIGLVHNRTEVQDRSPCAPPTGARSGRDIV